jgi:hypothetical protein
MAGFACRGLFVPSTIAGMHKSTCQKAPAVSRPIVCPKTVLDLPGTGLKARQQAGCPHDIPMNKRMGTSSAYERGMQVIILGFPVPAPVFQVAKTK